MTKIWNPNEDEILKISVLKFGLNNWEKISSCFFRRTPSNCKMRWYNWVDYRIKKFFWEDEEDRKVIFLGKKFKLNWRLISFFLRRSVTQSFVRTKLLCWVRIGNHGPKKKNDPTWDFFQNKPLNNCFKKKKENKQEPIYRENKFKKKIFEFKIRIFNKKGKKTMEKRYKKFNLDHKIMTRNTKSSKYFWSKKKSYLLFEHWILNRMLGLCIIRGDSITSISLEAGETSRHRKKPPSPEA